MAMPAARAILDANVLYQAPLRDTLLSAAELGLFEPYWSATILAEVERNLIARSFASKYQTHTRLATPGAANHHRVSNSASHRVRRPDSAHGE
jgi:hypothetical protein